MPKVFPKQEIRKNLDQSSELTVSVSYTDIINHLNFLASIEAQGDKFYDTNHVRNSLRRYENCWIPLILSLANNPDDDLKYAPPIGKYIHKKVKSLQVTFLKNGTKSLPKLTSENLKNKRL